MKKIHDYGYKFLFSHSGFVRQLLEYFIAMDWVKEVDFSRMERLNTSFVRKSYKNKESDVIYKLYFQDKPVYLYLLIEFQSTIDPSMPFRFFSYIADFYEELGRKAKNQSKHPLIFPVLLYNGDEPWNVPDNIRELIEEVHPALKEYVPSLKYFPVIIRDIPLRTLVKIRNALSAVFLIENLSEEEADLYLKEAAASIAQELPELKEAFSIWFSHLVNAGRKPVFEEILNMNPEEAKSMFATTIKNIEKKGIEKGKILTAQKLHKMGAELEFIAQATELSLIELEKILEEK